MVSEIPDRIHGERLGALRSIYGLTQAELADLLQVTQPFLSHIERGTRPGPVGLVHNACKQFNLPITFFTVVPDDTQVGPVTFRKNSRATARDESRVVALYNEAARVFQHVSAGSQYRTADLPNPADYNDDTELVAEALRSSIGLSGDEPVLNATRVVERLGIGVIDNLDRLEEGSRGHTAVSRPSRHNDRPLVALVADVPGAAKRLTVLHEVGHLIFDRHLFGPIKSTRSPEEKRAYQFAGAFLLPERVIREHVSESLNLHGYLPLKAEYGISVGAIIIRARDLGLITSERARSLQIQLSSQGWRSEEPVPVADEKPVLLSQAIRQVYGTQSRAKVAGELGVSPDWVAQWTHTHLDTLEPDPEPGNVLDLAAARARRSS